MAFAVHINMEHCTGCNNCVVACPVDTSELHTVDTVTTEQIYVVRDGRSVIPDFRGELSRRCGGCVQACPYGVIRLAGYGESRPAANVQQETA
ncbi:MAG: 4Fe-4S binding protein [Methanoregula sp.]|nr:4Fe-4S binding protein [Methanoregula sp.]